MSVVTSMRQPSFVKHAAFRRFTVDEYHKMIQAGILDDEDKVELLEGFVVEKMPRNPPHDVSIQRLTKRTVRIAPGWEVRIQSAITLPDSEPEPDVTLARGDDSTFAHRHPAPGEIGMVIEVADSSLDRDRDDKGCIYARAGVAVYWIVNLVDRQIEVYTQPSGPADAPGYGQRQDYHIGDSAPVVLDGQQVALLSVAEILP